MTQNRSPVIKIHREDLGHTTSRAPEIRTCAIVSHLTWSGGPFNLYFIQSLIFQFWTFGVIQSSVGWLGRCPKVVLGALKTINDRSLDDNSRWCQIIALSSRFEVPYRLCNKLQVIDDDEDLVCLLTHLQLGALKRRDTDVLCCTWLQRQTVWSWCDKTIPRNSLNDWRLSQSLAHHSSIEL